MLFRLAALLVAPALLADIHVDGSAIDCATGTGAVSDPVCSITAALAIASPGDTIRIAPGTYLEVVDLGFDVDLVGTGGRELTIVDGGFTGSVLSVQASVSATVDGLTLTQGRGTHGGGVFCLGDLTLRNSTVSNSLAIGGLYGNTNGGGVFVDSGNLTVEGCTITGNSVQSISGLAYGGGVHSKESATIISCTTISNNNATHGGGIRAFSGSLQVVRSSILENNANTYSGGISCSAAQFELTNSTVSGNTARRIAGLSATGLQPGSRIENSTITLNTAVTSRGGLTSGNTLPLLQVRNSIVAGNSLSSPGAFQETSDVDGSFETLGNNLIGVGNASFVDGVIADQVGSIANRLDPLLDVLQDNGGPTWTHEPLPGSPAINAAHPFVFEPFDQRGVARPIDAAPDIGAVESRGAYNGLCHGNGGFQHGCTNCPCNNNAPTTSSGGCLNSAGTSAELEASGDTSVSLPPNTATDLRFGMSLVVPSAFCILNSGDGVAPTNMANPCFGMNSGVQAMSFDGLRCAVINTRRHGGRFSDLNGEVGVTNLPWGGEAHPNAGIAAAGGGFVAGQTRYFQAIHRDDPLLSCMRGLNTSQAIEVTFTP